MREAKEEGWLVHGPLTEIQRKLVEGKECVWFAALFAVALDDYKEAHRIKNIVASKEAIAASGYGNDFIANLPA